MIGAQGLRLRRGGREVLAGVDFLLRPGELVALLGANGAGKSTLLAVLAGDLAPDAGQASLDGQPLGRLGAAALARRRAVLPQHSSLGFELSAGEVVAMGAYPYPELSPAQAEAGIGQALALADAQAFRDRPYGSLSGGEQQRVQCARVLLQALAQRLPGQSRFLMLDEPTASLDPLHQHGLLRAAGRLAHEHGLGVLVILHDINLAARWCDRLVFMAQGRIAADGPAAQVLRPAVLQQVYGLPARVLEDRGRPVVLFGD
ncbi:heme ABC transporter ATP-binding protein [Orrella sp. JC864]|uniref:heme ABC transporter ATP-binding protein n=1 Tax=Orrella sp. JC864 TaxID=3120298 RepID=UPI003009E1EC